MNDKTKLVLKGYLELNEHERNDLIKELNKTIDLSSSQKSRKFGEISMELGPVTRGCPCCGR